MIRTFRRVAGGSRCFPPVREFGFFGIPIKFSSCPRIFDAIGRAPHNSGVARSEAKTGTLAFVGLIASGFFWLELRPADLLLLWLRNDSVVGLDHGAAIDDLRLTIGYFRQTGT